MGAATAAKSVWDRRFEAGLGGFAIAVAASFAVFLVVLLLFGDVGAGHGSRQTPAGGHGASSEADATPGSHSGNGTVPGGGQQPPGLRQSFALVGLASIGLYVGAMVLWAGIRGRWGLLVRHVSSSAAMLLLVVLYLNARGGFSYDGHDWNRSFGDASVVLFAVTLGIGPLARLWRPAGRALAWRRETGVWATIAAAMHVLIFFDWSLARDWRLFFYPGHRDDTADSLGGDDGLVPTAFNAANVVGLVALAYALLLAVTSNDASQRWLRAGWSWLQDRSTTMWVLVLLHTWLFAYYVTREQVLSVGTLWAGFWMVLLLQTGAFVKTVWLRHRPRSAPPGRSTQPA